MAHPTRRWAIRLTDEVRQWLRTLRAADPDAYRSVNVAVDILAETGWLIVEQKRREEP